jgi:hypothetical protein
MTTRAECIKNFYKKKTFNENAKKRKINVYYEEKKNLYA